MVTTFGGRRGWPPPLLASLRSFIAGLGEGARCAGPTAAALLGFDGFGLERPFHAVTPRGVNRQRVGHVVHTSRSLAPIDCEEIDGIAVTSPTRTLIDLAATESTPRLTAALDGALRDLQTTERFLHERVVALRGRGRYGVPKLLEVIEGVEASRGGHSWLERRFLELVAGAGLPRPVPQAVLSRREGRLIRVDCHFPGTAVVVELLGYRYHRSSIEMQNDAARLNQLQLDGFLVVQFTYADVVGDPERVLATLGAALGRAAAA